MTIADARKVGAFHTLPPIEGNKSNLPQVHFAIKGLYSASHLRAGIELDCRRCTLVTGLELKVNVHHRRGKTRYMLGCGHRELPMRWLPWRHRHCRYGAPNGTSQTRSTCTWSPKPPLLAGMKEEISWCVCLLMREDKACLRTTFFVVTTEPAALIIWLSSLAGGQWAASFLFLFDHVSSANRE